MAKKEIKNTLNIALAPMQKTAEAGGLTTEKKTETDPDNGREYYTSITIDPFTYKDAGKGAKKELTDVFLYNLVKDNLLENWVEVANGCWIDARDSASIYYDFSTRFNTSQDPNCFGNIRPMLKCADSQSWGSPSRDNMFSSGLRTAKSLKEIRQEAVESIRKGIDHKALKTSDLTDQGPKDEAGVRHALYEMLKIGEEQEKNDTGKPVFYTYVTSVSEVGAKYSNMYIYDLYGIAFYEFEPRAIMADDLIYKSACDDCETPEEAKEKHKPGFSYDTIKKRPQAMLVRNYSENIAEGSVTRGTTETAEVTVSSSFEKQYTFGQKIGRSIQMESEIPFFKGSLTGSVELNFEETLSETKSTSTSKSNSFNNTTQASMKIDPHTAISTTSSDTEMIISEEFDTPSAISYKVCIFAMTGKCYADNAVVCDFKSYDHGYYVNIIGATNPVLGISAPENLYQRVMISPKAKRLDSDSCDCVVKWTDNSFSDENGVDWNSYYFTAEAPDPKKEIHGKESIDNLCKNIPMLSGGCKYDLVYKTTEYTIGDLKPLFLPAKFVITNGNADFNIKLGDKFNISNQIEVDCQDLDSIHYNDFKQADGEWVLCDKDGNEKESSDVIALATTGADEQTITGTGVGTAYVIFNLKKSVKYTACDEPGEVTRESHLKSPIVSITVSEKEFKGTVEVEKNISGCVGDTNLNLNKSLNVSVYDERQKKVGVPIVWDAQEPAADGISVKENGGITFTKEGTYHVRAVVAGARDVYSDWIEIVAKPAREIDRIEFPKFDNTLVISGSEGGEKRHSFDLSSYAIPYDQYGEKWEGDTSNLCFKLDEPSDCVKIENNVLTVEGQENQSVTISVSLRNQGNETTN